MNIRKMFRVMPLLIALLLIFSMLSACENNSGQSTQSSTEKATEKATEPPGTVQESKPSETQSQGDTSPGEAGDSKTLVFYPKEDSMSNFNKQDEINGTAVMMGLVGSEGYEKFGFFKFEISGVKGEIEKAIFRIYCVRTKDEVTGNTEVWSCDNGWSESTLSWTTMPAKKEKIGEYVTPSDGEWAEVDLTDYFKAGDGTYSFVLIPTGEGRGFLATKDTDQGQEFKPYLEITTK